MHAFSVASKVTQPPFVTPFARALHALTRNRPLSLNTPNDNVNVN
jgi:hypothetical protein